MADRQRALILSGGIFHPFAESSAHLASLLAAHGIDARVEEDPATGFAALAEEPPELLVLNLLRWRMLPEKYDAYRDEWAYEIDEASRAAVCGHLGRGGGILALHTATICFDTWPEYGQLLGGRWVWGSSFHPELGPQPVRQTEADHVITRGIGPFEVEDELYSALVLEPDVAPLLEGEHPEVDGVQPLLWAREVAGGRVVYDALGHDAASLAQPEHSRIIQRAALWTLGRSDAELLRC